MSVGYRHNSSSMVRCLEMHCNMDLGHGGTIEVSTMSSSLLLDVVRMVSRGESFYNELGYGEYAICRFEDYTSTDLNAGDAVHMECRCCEGGNAVIVACYGYTLSRLHGRASFVWPVKVPGCTALVLATAARCSAQHLLLRVLR